MQGKRIRLICALAALLLAVPLVAQYGHPLKGTWSGDWWLVKGQENHVLLDFNFTATGYGATKLTGVLNPGPDQAEMKNLTLTPPDVVKAGQAAVAARDAALAKQAAEAAANPPAAPAAGAATAAKGAAPAPAAPARGAATAPKAAAPAATGQRATPAVKDNITIAQDPWLLHFEADTKDAAGKPVHFIVDGKMENLGAAYSRVISGTWKNGTQVGSFKVVRN